MNKIGPRQKRSLSFEALEGRLTLSSSLHVASPHIQALVMSHTQAGIPATFSGRTSINGSTVVISGLTGRIGNDRFSGHGSGPTSGNIFQGGDIVLSNSHGTVHLKLSAATVTQVGKRSRQEVPLTVVESTGKYAKYTGATGFVTTWNIPARPNATSTFSGFLT
jgi:hypothetical protein